MLPPLTHASSSRAPLMLSTLACVMSGAALMISLSGAPSRSSAELPAAVNPVTISGLRLGPGQLAAGAVNSAALADAAVLSSAIADGAVTAPKLSPDAITTIARGVTASVNIVGEVDEDGQLVRGKGFTAQRVATGEYELSFTNAFLAPPVVVAAAQSYGVCYLPRAAIGEASVRIKVCACVRACARSCSYWPSATVCLTTRVCAWAVCAVLIRPARHRAHASEHEIFVLRKPRVVSDACVCVCVRPHACHHSGAAASRGVRAGSSKVLRLIDSSHRGAEVSLGK